MIQLLLRHGLVMKSTGNGVDLEFAGTPLLGFNTKPTQFIVRVARDDFKDIAIAWRQSANRYSREVTLRDVMNSLGHVLDKTTQRAWLSSVYDALVTLMPELYDEDRVCNLLGLTRVAHMTYMSETDLRIRVILDDNVAKVHLGTSRPIEIHSEDRITFSLVPTVLLAVYHKILGMHKGIPDAPAYQKQN